MLENRPLQPKKKVDSPKWLFISTILELGSRLHDRVFNRSSILNKLVLILLGEVISCSPNLGEPNTDSVYCFVMSVGCLIYFTIFLFKTLPF